jgi:hypothetical protein
MRFRGRGLGIFLPGPLWRLFATTLIVILSAPAAGIISLRRPPRGLVGPASFK